MGTRAGHAARTHLSIASPAILPLCLPFLLGSCRFLSRGLDHQLKQLLLRRGWRLLCARRVVQAMLPPLRRCAGFVCGALAGASCGGARQPERLQLWRSGCQHEVDHLLSRAGRWRTGRVGVGAAWAAAQAHHAEGCGEAGGSQLLRLRPAAWPCIHVGANCQAHNRYRYLDSTPACAEAAVQFPALGPMPGPTWGGINGAAARAAKAAHPCRAWSRRSAARTAAHLLLLLILIAGVSSIGVASAQVQQRPRLRRRTGGRDSRRGCMRRRGRSHTAAWGPGGAASGREPALEVRFRAW